MKKKAVIYSSVTQADQHSLTKWYRKNKRPLPWRKKKKNPYHIWVSEVMLQQTTVNAVIPYYEKFIKKFSTLKSLAKTPLPEVLPYWSGLGYYSRVKNLHKSAKIIHEKKYFPKTYKELMKLPGFGPYTARAVSSLAFEETVGVLDANVIRVLCRYLGFKKAWWKTKEKNFLQKEVDKWTTNTSSSLINQALMELGSLICTVKKPLCLACPLNKNCKAFKKNQISLIPLKKKKKEKEIWFWKPIVLFQKNKIALINNHSLPVLKNYPLLPGKAVKRKNPPTRYDFIHSITHHNIYILTSKKKSLSLKNLSEQNFLWSYTKDLHKQNPSSLLQKVLSYSQNL